MKTARYVSKLVDDRERYFETAVAISSILNKNNLAVINGHAMQGYGEYWDIFEDDMVLAHTVVSFAVDNAGRPFNNLDVVARKYDGNDKRLILELLKNEQGFALMVAHNGGELRNPLPEVNET